MAVVLGAFSLPDEGVIMPRICSVIIGLVVCTAEVQASPAITNLGVLPGATISRASAISGDGSAIAGGCYFSDGPLHAFRWTSSGGMQDLGVLPGCTSAYGVGISDDGLTVVGDSATAVGQISEVRRLSGGCFLTDGTPLVP